MKQNRNWLRAGLGMALALLLLVGATVPALAQAAADPAQDGGLLGVYDNAGERLLIRERGGQLELVYDTMEDCDVWFAGYSTYPLRTAGEAFRVLACSPLRRDAAGVSFERDMAGRGRILRIGGKEYRRHFFDFEEGRTFRIKALLGGSGFLAVYLMAIIAGNSELVYRPAIFRFNGGFAWMMQIFMFVLLGWLVFPEQLADLALPGFSLAVLLMVVARPACRTPD